MYLTTGNVVTAASNRPMKLRITWDQTADSKISAPKKTPQDTGDHGGGVFSHHQMGFNFCEKGNQKRKHKDIFV